LNILFTLSILLSEKKEREMEVGQILVDQMLCPMSADRHKVRNLGASAGTTKLSVNITWPTKANVNNTLYISFSCQPGKVYLVK